MAVEGVTCQERLEHWTKTGKGVNCDWDEDHVFVVEFANDFIAVYRWGGGSCWFADVSEFASFMRLKMVICIGSDGLDDVFRCMMFWGWCGSCDGDICADGCVGAQWWKVGFGLNDMSNGRAVAVGSDRRCRCVSMSNLVFG